MSKKNIKFLTEGYADILLLDILEIPLKYIQRTGSISKLSKSMKNQSKNFIGLVDADNGESFKFFEEFNFCIAPDNIILKHKANTKQYVIFLLPKAIEKWILDAAKSVEIKPEDYKLSSDIKKFKKETKNENIYKNKNLIKFIRDIKKKKAEPFVFLQEILQKLLTENNYPCIKN